MIKLLVVVFIVVGLILAAPFVYREYTIRDARDPADDDSINNELLSTFTPKVKVFDVFQSSEFNLGTPIVDVRSKEEFDAGHLSEAVSILEEDIYEDFEKKFPEKNIKVFVYGRRGAQGAVAARLLRNMGYTAYYVQGGFEAWRKAGYKISVANSMYF